MFEGMVGALPSPAAAGPDAGPGVVPDGGERITAIVARERLIARLQAEQAELAVAHAAAAGRWGGGGGVAAEVALARGVSPLAAQFQLHTAQVLVQDLPGLFDLLHRGEISWAAGAAVVRETGVVDAPLRREIDRRLAAQVEKGAARWVAFGDSYGPAGPDDGFPADGPPAAVGPGPVREVSELVTVAEVVHGVAQLTVLPEIRPQAATTARLAAAARRLVALLDPAAAAKRAARVADERRVDIVTGADGAAELVARLPAAQAAACWHALDHHARGRRADGDDRTITQLMADTLVERLTGITAATGPPPPAAHIHIVIKATTLTGHDDHPAQLAGHGPLTADTARTIAHNATARWRRLVVDDTGHALTIDRTTRTGTTPSPITDWLRRPIDWTPTTTTATDRRTYTGTLRSYLLARDGHCRMPTCTTKITDADHITPHHTGGRTTANNGQGLSTRCHHLRDLPRWHLHGTADHTIWTTPTGHHYHSYPPPALGWASEPP